MYWCENLSSRWYNSRPHFLCIVYRYVQIKENGESCVLCASWPIYGGYERRFWKIRKGASARMPLSAMVPWKTNCWSSVSTASTIGYQMRDQDKGLLLSKTSMKLNLLVIPWLLVTWMLSLWLGIFNFYLLAG